MLSALVDEMNAILETEQYRQRGVKNRGGGVYRPSQLGIVWRRILEDRGAEGLLAWFKEHLQETLDDAVAVRLSWAGRTKESSLRGTRGSVSCWTNRGIRHHRHVASRAATHELGLAR
jgi:hypothetical protein